MKIGPRNYFSFSKAFFHLKAGCKPGKVLVLLFLQIAALALIMNLAAAQAVKEEGNQAEKHQPQQILRGKNLSDLKIINRNSRPINTSGMDLQEAAQDVLQSTETSEILSDRMLVAFQDGVTPFEKMEILNKVSPALRLDRDSSNSFFDVINFSDGSPEIDKAILQLKNDPRVRIAEPDYVVHALATIPNDPNFQYLWNLRNVGQGTFLMGLYTCTTCSKPGADISATKAWDLTTGSADVVVSVIDSGVDYKHPDLAANILRDSDNKVVGYDFVNNDNDPMDDLGHGTHCSGTIGAVGNNDIGIASVSWNVKIMPIKFLNSSGSGMTSDAVKAVDFAVAHGAHILSNSWGGGSYSLLLQEAIRRAEKAGVLFVAAAGNSNVNTDKNPYYPGGYNQYLSNVISVAATDYYDVLAYFSNYGPKTCDIAAPGYSIYSTVPSGSCAYCTSTGYASMSGTSMAAPHVAGVAALIKAKFPGLSLAEIKARLFYSADRPSEIDGYTRWGRLNAFAALQSDTIAPDPPANFSISQASGTGLRLTWNATGDDGNSGKASVYQVLYNTVFDIETATKLDPGIAPGPSGTEETYDLTGLNPQTSYYVFLRAYDKAGNSSLIVAAGPVATNSVSLYDGAESKALFETDSGPAWKITEEEKHSGQKSYASSAEITTSQSSILRMINPIKIDGPTYVAFWAKQDLDVSDYLYVEVMSEYPFRFYTISMAKGSPSWTRYQFDLSQFAGLFIRIRFYLYTRSSTSSTASHRVWLDDFSIVKLTKGWEDNVEGSPQFVGFSPWRVTDETSSSSTHAWSDSPNAKYGNNARLPLMQTSSIVPPSSLGSFNLVFKAKTDLEKDKDYLEIYASLDDGANWEYISAITGTSDWTQYAFNFPGGKKVRIMFFLTTNEAVVKDGIYIDDIGIWGEPFDSVASIDSETADDPPEALAH